MRLIRCSAPSAKILRQHRQVFRIAVAQMGVQCIETGAVAEAEGENGAHLGIQLGVDRTAVCTCSLWMMNSEFGKSTLLEQKLIDILHSPDRTE